MDKDTIQFELKIKQGLTTVLDLKGRELRRSNFTLGQLDEIIMLEQKMEALLGFRFHINEVIKEEITDVERTAS